MYRRNFLKGTAMGSMGWLLQPSFAGTPADADPRDYTVSLPASPQDPIHENLDLSPAVWIWYPSGRCLPNTCILFRREIDLEERPLSTSGWLLGESRYLLFVNGHRVQWGPAPSDPRYSEADPLHQVSSFLKKGKNVIGIQCLFYGQGDGTWPIGKAGLLARLDIQLANGKQVRVVTDASWQTHLALAWQPGRYKRWFLRALQEQRDERLYPVNWHSDDFHPGDDWHPAMECGRQASKPAICNNYQEYQLEIFGDPSVSFIRPRSVPMLQEEWFPVAQLTETAWLRWKVPAAEYFDCLPPAAFEVIRETAAVKTGEDEWTVKQRGSLAAVLTFEWDEQAVGWPGFSVKAPEGTVVELLVQEAHHPGGPALINSHFHSWTRFICREGWNHFETFDFESCRWMQLHIRDHSGDVLVKRPGMRRRRYPWPQQPLVTVDDERIQKVVDASVNTLYNCAQDTIVDGMGRERQQYSGDGSHQLHAIYSTLGDTRLPARFVNTFGQGATLEGYFFDSWPAYDRLARVMERQLQLTGWGPILDHSVGFCFDCWYYYLYTGSLGALHETFPRLLGFFRYLQGIRGRDGLLPVSGLGLPSVWIDHEAYREQREKQCAFNLYVSAMCTHALAPLCRAFGLPDAAAAAGRFGQALLDTAIARFWSAGHGAFVNNLPWMQPEDARFCDRSLAMSVLFDQCPGGNNKGAAELLSALPANVGLSYPANAIWRLWALAKAGRIQTVLDELRGRWYSMESVLLNNSLQEFWHAQPDSGALWSHCAVAPLIILHMGIAGIRPTAPGYGQCEIRPQFGDLTRLDINTHTVKGPLIMRMTGNPGARRLQLKVPAGIRAMLVLDARETLPIPATGQKGGLKEYLLQGEKQHDLLLKYT